jgi:hypothetical protein
MQKLTINPDGDYDEITVEQIDTYRRRVEDDGAVTIQIKSRQGGSWKDLEEANKYQDRTCRIKLDKNSVEALVLAVTNASIESKIG